MKVFPVNAKVFVDYQIIVLNGYIFENIITVQVGSFGSVPVYIRINVVMIMKWLPIVTGVYRPEESKRYWPAPSRMAR